MAAQSHATTPRHPSLHTSAMPDRRAEATGRGTGTGAGTDRKGRLARGMRYRETSPSQSQPQREDTEAPGLRGEQGPGGARPPPPPPPP